MGRFGAMPHKKRRNREAGERHQQQILAAEIIRQPAGDGKNDGVGDEIRGEDPRGFVHGRRQAAGDVRQGHVDHGGVQHLHEGAEHHRNRDEPRVYVMGVDVGVQTSRAATRGETLLG